MRCSHSSEREARKREEEEAVSKRSQNEENTSGHGDLEPR